MREQHTCPGLSLRPFPREGRAKGRSGERVALAARRPSDFEPPAGAPPLVSGGAGIVPRTLLGAAGLSGRVGRNRAAERNQVGFRRLYSGGRTSSRWLTPSAVANSKMDTMAGLRRPCSSPLMYCWRPRASCSCVRPFCYLIRFTFHLTSLRMSMGRGQRITEYPGR